MGPVLNWTDREMQLNYKRTVCRGVRLGWQTPGTEKRVGEPTPKSLWSLP